MASASGLPMMLPLPVTASINQTRKVVKKSYNVCVNALSEDIIVLA